MIYDLLIAVSFPFMFALLEMVELTTSRIHLMIYLIDTCITNIDKICCNLGQIFKFLCNLIGCEAHEGAE